MRVIAALRPLCSSETLNNGYKGNAFQHCAWTARMTQKMDYYNNQQGRAIGDAHEKSSGAYTTGQSAEQYSGLLVLTPRKRGPW